jgi:trans-2,3-dihydro-3-hydroxyanthranilate isomerase
MPSYEFLTVDVFTERRFGGNPLAVFPRAAGLGDAQMQDLARELNLSETTFVLPPADPAHTARVRIFTPGKELPFAGHPNVGTAFVLACLNPHPAGSLVFEELAGLVPIEIQRGGDGRATGAKIAAPQPLCLGESVPAETAAACASLEKADIRRELHAPLFAGVGMGFVIAEVASREALARAAPNLGAFRESAVKFPSIGNGFQLHLYFRDPSDGGRLAARMFAPLIGVLEDPATGSANAALAALLLHLAPKGPPALSLDIEQGVEMGRPSRLLATASRSPDRSVRATVEGSCVPVLAGRAEV